MSKSSDGSKFRDMKNEIPVLSSANNHTKLRQSVCLDHGKKLSILGEGHLKVKVITRVKGMKNEIHSSADNHTKLRQSVCLGHGKKRLTFG